MSVFLVSFLTQFGCTDVHSISTENFDNPNFVNIYIYVWPYMDAGLQSDNALGGIHSKMGLLI
jgi:hypothetical protein